VIQELQSLYQTSDNAGVHAAAGWALRQHGKTMEELETLIAEKTENQLTGSRDWYVSAAVTGQPTQAGVVAAPGFTMVRIRSDASFQLGAVAGDREDKNPGDEDQSKWTAEDKAAVGEFWLSDREVSLGQFRALCPERFQSQEDLPLEPDEEPKGQGPMNNVNWYDALIFCNRLSVSHGLEPYYELDESGYDWEAGEQKNGAKFPSIPNPAGTGYRLPTEREWEYACRALSAVSYSFGSEANRLSLYGWYAGKSSPSVCGFQRPSRWGVYDMHGNVLEWCWDRYDATAEEGFGTSRVLRGGSFNYNIPDILRSAYRYDYSPDYRNSSYGFRISRTK